MHNNRVYYGAEKKTATLLAEPSTHGDLPTTRNLLTRSELVVATKGVGVPCKNL